MWPYLFIYRFIVYISLHVWGKLWFPHASGRSCTALGELSPPVLPDGEQGLLRQMVGQNEALMSTGGRQNTCNLLKAACKNH